MPGDTREDGTDEAVRALWNDAKARRARAFAYAGLAVALLAPLTIPLDRSLTLGGALAVASGASSLAALVQAALLRAATPGRATTVFLAALPFTLAAIGYALLANALSSMNVPWG